MNKRWLRAALVAAAFLPGVRTEAQTVPSARVNVLAAEDRRAVTPRDLATLRGAARSADPQTARIAVRALGRLERTDVIPDITPALRHALPELRSEAANALAQAARAWSAAAASPGKNAGGATLPSLQSLLIARLADEDEPSVRAAISQSLGRLPYRSVDQVDAAERALLEQLELNDTITDRLGVAKALESFVRVARPVRPASPAVAAALKSLSGVPVLQELHHPQPGRPKNEPDLLRDARVRRLALEALVAIDAADPDVVAQAALDADPQVRRLAMKAVTETKQFPRDPAFLARGLEDPMGMVRLEALRGVGQYGGEQACAASVALLSDPDAHVALLAIDQLAGCGASAEAVSRLEQAVKDPAAATAPRAWHRAAHATVALALAAPAAGAAAVRQMAGSTVWQLRMYAARAAIILKDRERLEQFARDPSDNVVETAIEGLRAVAGHDGDAVYVTALSRRGYQAIRMAALALEGSPNAETVVPALTAALQRLLAEGHANSLDTRTALSTTLTHLGGTLPRSPAARAPSAAVPNGDALRRLAAPRARITIEGVGAFDLALFTAEAPLTVLRFAELAESRYYNGLTFHRVLANFVIQGGSPDANEYVGQTNHMRDEVGLWPHVRGTVGISTRGRDTGDAQIFVDMVDNPRLDHQYTVFAQVLNGMDVVDRILEGDVIKNVEILP